MLSMTGRTLGCELQHREATMDMIRGVRAISLRASSSPPLLSETDRREDRKRPFSTRAGPGTPSGCDFLCSTSAAGRPHSFQASPSASTRRRHSCPKPEP